MKLEAKIIRYNRGKWNRRVLHFELHPADTSPELDELLYRYADEALNGSLLFVPATEQPKPEKKKTTSIYQFFKFQCDELGVDYEREKDNIGKEKGIQLAHMKELETIMSVEEVEAFLRARLWTLKQEIGIFS